MPSRTSSTSSGTVSRRINCRCRLTVIAIRTGAFGRLQQVAQAADRSHLDAGALDLLADATDVDLHGAQSGIGIPVVELLEKLGLRHDLPASLDQRGENHVFVAGEVDREAVGQQALPRPVEN